MHSTDCVCRSPACCRTRIISFRVNHMISSCEHRFFVLTGGPGSGKTTLLNALSNFGYQTAPEAGRAIIRHQQAIGGPALPWNNPALFAEMMLQWEMRSYEGALASTGRVFFDRAVPDVIGYLGLSGLAIPNHITAAAERFRYNRRAFILPPWPEIFTQDAERRQDLQTAICTYEAIVEAYAHCGYELLEIPRLPVKERARFLLANI
jgi:predicted ATPase